MIEESQIKKLRGSGKIPEYRQLFPPELGGLYDNKLASLVGEANLAIGNLNSAARAVPANPDLLIGPLLLKEAVSSSRIEGTQATVRDVLKQEANMTLPSRIAADVVEVRNHRETTFLGLDMLKKLPLSNRVFKEMHRRLMQGVRGEMKRRGEFRAGSNVIAKDESVDSIIYIPPPADEVQDLMFKLEKYINQKESIDPIIRCALIHYEFEAIHPFADGNGRLGRVLNSLFLIEQGVLEYPLLYFSGYLLRNKDEYYKKLLSITKNEEWKPWLEFFLEGVKEQAQRSRSILENISNLYDSRKKVVEDKISSKYAVRLLDLIFQSPIITAQESAKRLGLVHHTAIGILREMVALGILKIADTRAKKNIPFANEDLISLLQRT